MRKPVGIIFDIAPIPGSHSRTYRRACVPERYTKPWARFLLAADGISALCAALLVLPPAHRLPALGFTGIVLAVFALCGMYAKTFAVYARDEAYAVVTAFLIVLLPSVALFIVGGISLDRAVVAVVLAAAVICTMRALLTAARRYQTDVDFAGVDFIGGDAAERSQRPSFRAAQRAFDLILASAAAVLLAPLMLVVAAAVLLDSGAPVLFRQERVGRDGTRFNILKFRTMRKDSDGNWVRPGDRRITRIGSFLRRTSIDELPQIFNVLAGTMSIVGPRPEMCSFADGFRSTIPHYDERHFLKPGITGWAQVYLKRNLHPSEIADVLPYDLFYVQHASLFLNAILVFKTAFELVFHRAV